MPLDPFVPLFMKGSMLRVSSQGQSKCERQYESLHLYNIEYIVYNEQYVTHDIYINMYIYISVLAGSVTLGLLSGVSKQSS